MKDNSLLRGVGLAILTVIIWSGNFIVARGVHNEIPAISLAFCRWSVAVVVFAPFAWKGIVKEWPLIRARLHYFFWLGFCGIALFNTFVYVAGHHTSAINLALIGTTSSPIMAIILARIFLKERIGLSKILGVIICVSGILYLLARGNWHNLAHFKFSEGDAWVLLGAFCFAVYNILVRKKPVGISSVSFLFTAIFIGWSILVPLFIIECCGHHPITWSGSLVGVLLYLGVGASIISYLLWNNAIRILGAGRTALFGNLIPVFASLEAVFILHEAFTIHHVISMVVVFTGLLVANLALFKKQAAPAQS